MRASWGTTRRDDYLSDALTLLAGWSRDEHEITRTLALDDAEHAALTERIKVVSDALQVRPEIRRSEGQTRIRLSTAAGGGLTAGEVTMAARIEDAYRTITRGGNGQATPFP
jgi:4a-hydroxytetrahydrobiopterin dehydratase